MRNNTKLLIPALLATALMAAPAMAQDKAKPAADKPAAMAKPAAAPAADKKAAMGTTKTILSNDKYLVTEVSYKPGAGSEMKERPARIARALTTGDMERTYPDGKKEVVHWKAGETKAFPKETFANKNVGKGDMSIFVVTAK
jgi:hypothetical protein